MNKSLALIPVVFAIFALMLSPAVMSAYADTENNGRDKGTKTANGCDNDKGKAGDSKHNPNCGPSAPLGNTDCTYISTGGISPDDLSFAIFGDFITAHVTISSNWIATSEINTGEEDPDGEVDHDSELIELNTILLADTGNNPLGKTCF